MVPHFSFDHQFEAMIPTRDQWEDADAPMVPEGAITVYTDGSSEPRGTGAGILFNGLLTDLSIPLGTYASVFQAEMYAITKCATVLQTLDLTNTCVYICSDSQAAIRAIRKPRTTSKLVRGCIIALDALAALHLVCVTWIPGHTGKQGNEQISLHDKQVGQPL